MKTKTIFRFFLFAVPLIAIVLLFSKCKKDSNDAQQPVVQAHEATIAGRVYSPSGKTIGAVEVIAASYHTLTGSDGSFTLKVAPGIYKLILQSGSGHVFRTEIDITVATDEVLNLDPVETVLKQTQMLAYIPGSFDHIETVIIDTLGYSATMISLNDLSSLPSITPYAAIFMNCGLQEMSQINMDSTKYANLQSYLVGLGSIYASDFAVECLTGDGFLRPGSNLDYSLSRNGHHNGGGINVLSTCISPMLGGFMEDTSLCTSKMGVAGMVLNAHINDPNIVTLLGKDSMDVFYDLGGWEVINLVDQPFTTLITDNQLNGPLAVSTDFNDESPGGVIYFTTFHNEVQGNYSEDVQHILEYFILNL